MSWLVIAVLSGFQFGGSGFESIELNFFTFGREVWVARDLDHSFGEALGLPHSRDTVLIQEFGVEDVAAGHQPVVDGCDAWHGGVGADIAQGLALRDSVADLLADGIRVLFWHGLFFV